MSIYSELSTVFKLSQELNELKDEDNKEDEEEKKTIVEEFIEHFQNLFSLTFNTEGEEFMRINFLKNNYNLLQWIIQNNYINDNTKNYLENLIENNKNEKDINKIILENERINNKNKYNNDKEDEKEIFRSNDTIKLIENNYKSNNMINKNNNILMNIKMDNQIKNNNTNLHFDYNNIKYNNNFNYINNNQIGKDENNKNNVEENEEEEEEEEDDDDDNDNDKDGEINDNNINLPKYNNVKDIKDEYHEEKNLIEDVDVKNNLKEDEDNQKKESEEEEENKKICKINNDQNNISINRQLDKKNKERINENNNYENKNDEKFKFIDNNINKSNNNISSDDDDKNSINIEKNNNKDKDKSDEQSLSENDKESISSEDKSAKNIYIMDNLLDTTIKNLFIGKIPKEKKEKNFNDLFKKLEDISRSKNKPQNYKDKLITLICIFFPFCSEKQKAQIYDVDFIDEELEIYLQKTLLYYKKENEIYKKFSLILSKIHKKMNKKDKTKNLNFENKNLILKSEEELFILYIFLIIYKIFGSNDDKNKKTFEKKYYLKEFYFISFKLYFILSHQEYYPCISDNFLDIYERLFFIKKFYTESLTNKFEPPYIISKIKNVQKEKNKIGYIYNGYILGEQKDSDIKKLFSDDELDINEKVFKTIKHFYKIDEDNGIDLLNYANNPELDNKNYNFVTNIIDIIYHKKYINIKNVKNNLTNLEKNIQKITKHLFNKKGDINNQKYSRNDKKEIFNNLIREIKSKLERRENIHFYPIGSVTEFLYFNDEKNNFNDDLNIAIDMYKLNPSLKKSALHNIYDYLKKEYHCKMKQDLLSKYLLFEFSYEKTKIALIVLGYGPYIHSILFRAYSLMDPRFPIVGLTLKYFLRKIGFLNQFNNHFSFTFVFISLLVTFLQDIIQPPILPKIFNDKISPIFFITIPFSKGSNEDKFKINTFIDELEYKSIHYPEYIFNKERLKNIYNEQIGNNKNSLTCTEIFLYFLEFLIYYFKYDTLYVNTSLQFEGFDSINNILKDDEDENDFNDNNLSIKYPNDIYFKEYVKNNLSIKRKGIRINNMKGFLLIRDPVNPFYNPGDILYKNNFNKIYRKIKIGHDILLRTGNFEELKDTI